MKRFWKEVQVAPEGGGWTVRLDERALRTPARAPLIVPTQRLAEAIADEWRDAPEQVDPRVMPLTGLANAALDRVAPDRDSFAAGLASYGGSDLACYRAEGPQGLVERQAKSWDALLSWARRRFDIDFRITCGVMPVAQPQPTLDRLAHALVVLDPFRLAGLSPLVTIGGSLVAALGVLEKALSVEDAWQAVSLDESWQLEVWGADPEAEAALENRRRDFQAAARFLSLLDD